MERLFSLSLVLGLLACAAPSLESTEQTAAITSASQLERPVRMNEIQTKATHNSYHRARFWFPGNLDYTFEPLDVQLERQGVRSFELDLHFKGSKFETYHAANDSHSTCKRFTDCLKTLKTWSDAHTEHPPLLVLLEAKDDADDVDVDRYVAKLDEELLSVWPQDRLVTPDRVKGTSGSVREAIETRGWPDLDTVRGRALFVLIGDDRLRDAYTHGDSNLDGRVAFVKSGRDKPYASVLVMDDPKADSAQIQDAVRAGFLVRTRADAALKEPKKGDTSRLEAALASGAQMVSTDYPAKVGDVPYVAEIPGGAPFRCNPVNAPSGCTSETINETAR